MRLYHAFLRPRYAHPTEEQWAANDAASFDALRCILRFGPVCTPEDFDLYPSPDSQSPARRSAHVAGKPYDAIKCSRLCFTLMERSELSKVYRVGDGPGDQSAHRDLFGRFAIGLDPLEARQLGVLPAVYYYRADAAVAGFQRRPDAPLVSDLGEMIQHRLDEVRAVMAVLAYVEAAASRDVQVPSDELLKQIGIELHHEPVAKPALDAASLDQLTQVMHIFNTDREAAWSIHGFIHILLSLFQTSDSQCRSRFGGAIAVKPLAFFNQREWRLVQHHRLGLEWYSLGQKPVFADPNAQAHAGSAGAVREQISTGRRQVGAPPLGQGFFDDSWVLHSCGGLPFRTWVRDIVVPQEWLGKVGALVEEFHWPFGAPEVVAATPRWTLDTSDAMPKVVATEAS